MDKKGFAAPQPKPLKPKRPPTSTVASSSRKPVQNANKEKIQIRKKNTTIAEGDISIFKPEVSTPDFDAEYRQIAYGKFMRAMLEECLVDEKVEREETQMDIQMAQLADRFQKTVDQLDKTNRRLKEINFVVEQKRLLDLKNQDCSQFYETTEKSQVEELVNNLKNTEQASLDKLQTKNVNFGYDKESGHKQLLDAVNDAIEGLEQIKKHSNLNLEKFKEYEKSQKSLHEIERERFDLESLKTEFETRFPSFTEKLISEASDRIAKLMDNDD
ncbi:uncharacterized protein LOC115455492 [Manduca sexta]|uniref:uncharacterized protein LOC115455492 n=1 Tax=Manduca sexta TaxID=7130 RepID=UPI00188FE588|nr:uncharacterized protein LOC115455492 [Manduca sexta]